MGAPIYFAPLRTPIVDPNSPDGLMSRDWYLFFQALWIRVGGAIGGDEALVLPLSGSDAAVVSSLSQALDQSPQAVSVTPDPIATEISDLRAQVAQLSQIVQDIKQGQVVL